MWSAAWYCFDVLSPYKPNDALNVVTSNVRQYCTRAYAFLFLLLKPLFPVSVALFWGFCGGSDLCLWSGSVSSKPSVKFHERRTKVCQRKTKDSHTDLVEAVRGRQYDNENNNLDSPASLESSMRISTPHTLVRMLVQRGFTSPSSRPTLFRQYPFMTLVGRVFCPRTPRSAQIRAGIPSAFDPDSKEMTKPPPPLWRRLLEIRKRSQMWNINSKCVSAL